MKFSVCIPNYNYGKFLGRTIQSVLDQTYADFEILISDNHSTDESVAVVRGFADPRIQATVNRCNVGFAANLDRAARGATGDFLLLLSSDDVMRPDALATYARALSALGGRADETVLCSSCDAIDENDRVTDHLDLPRGAIWRESDRDVELSSALDVPAYRIVAAQLLRRSVPRMQNPLFFCATAYPRRLYETIEGYGGNRLIGPDKWFHWRLLAVTESVVFLRKPLFAYRWHLNNQVSQQAQSGAIKYLLDGYMNSFEADAALLEKAGMRRDELEQAFIEFDVVRHGMAVLSEGRRTLARRTLAFGRAVYPHHLRSNWHAWVFRSLLALGPLGTWAARQLRDRYAEPAAPTNGDVRRSTAGSRSPIHS
jgi:glycosyltransferase involved in cell wall biosynthesis